MDNRKVCDSRLNERNIKSSFLDFLHGKSPRLSKTSDSFQTSISKHRSPTSAPSYLFRIAGFEIKGHVEYQIEMCECYKILGRRQVNKTMFKTRYSMLERLNEKLQKKSFPSKKIFGNRDPQFVKSRGKQLEAFLNEISSERSVEFLKFVKQVKDTDFNKELNRKFQLE